MKVYKLTVLILLLSSCNSIDTTSETLKVGTCYHTSGDVGGVPNILFCVQTRGVDGFLSCQGSTSTRYNEDLQPVTKWRWYDCGSANSWKGMSTSRLMIIECPTTCLGVNTK